ncbi:MAG: c-type cytochrome domain-containing protein [Bauldia sp.]
MSLSRWIPAAALAGLTAVAAGTAIAQPAPTWAQIGPIFAANCTGCHGQGGRAGLNLSSYATAVAGSNNGPVLIAGNPADSLLMKRITGEIPPQMPRGGNPPLSADTIALIAAWITAGLPE